MKVILQYFDELDKAHLTFSKRKAEDVIVDMRIYEHFLLNVYEADFRRYLIEKRLIEDHKDDNLMDKMKFRRLAKSKVGSMYHKTRDQMFLFEDNFYSYTYISGPPNPIVIYQWEHDEILKYLNDTLSSRSRRLVV